MSLHADVDIQQLYKNGEELCGDNVIVTRSPDNTTIVISDGLGSGVKANILATMTTKIASSMLKRNIKLDEVVKTIAETLPVCKVRKIAYSTLQIIKIDTSGRATVVEFDCPPTFFIRDGQVTPFPVEKRQIGDKLVGVGHLQLLENDILVAVSDGVIHAGLGANNKRFLTAIPCITDDLCRTADKIRRRENRAFAFRVRQNKRIGVIRQCPINLLHRQFSMDWTATVIENNILFRNLLRHKRSQVSIRNKKYVLVGQFFAVFVYKLSCLVSVEDHASYHVDRGSNEIAQILKSEYIEAECNDGEHRCGVEWRCSHLGITVLHGAYEDEQRQNE